MVASAALLLVCFAFSCLARGEVALADACPNAAARTGPSAALEDCRAYERVSPPDANGLPLVESLEGLPRNLFQTELITASGDSFLFRTSGGSLEEPEGNGGLDQYEARRTGEGWVTVRRLNPSGAEAILPNAGGVNASHTYDFYNAQPVSGEDNSGSLTEEGEANYLGNPDGSFELLGVGALGTERLAEGQWITPDGSLIVFTTGGFKCSGSSVCEIKKLEERAPSTGTPAVYQRTPDGLAEVVSLLPGDVTPGDGEAAEYQGVSTDGSVIAFRIGGVLYVRVDGKETKEVAAGTPTFAGITKNGSEIFYVLGGDVYRFEIGTGDTVQLTTTSDVELVNVSTDGSHAYFLSPSQLDAGAGVAGEPNLYVWSEALGIKFIATVSPSDLFGEPSSLNRWTSHVVTPDTNYTTGPGATSSRTTPRGDVLAFESRAKLTGYENAGHNEIYLYRESTGSLSCLSCNPSGEPAIADARFEFIAGPGVSPEAVIHNLTDDGQQVFFETSEALVERDVDGINDIYEWSNDGVGGSLALISSGRSADYVGVFGFRKQTNLIFGITPSGRDVIFNSWDPLVPSAGRGGVPTIYDARVGGGFPEGGAAACAASLCESDALGAPELASPTSHAFRGKGNVRRHRCKRNVQRGHAGKHKTRSCKRRRKAGAKRSSSNALRGQTATAKGDN